MTKKKHKVKKLISRKLLFLFLVICFAITGFALFAVQKLPVTYKNVTYYPVKISGNNSRIFFSDAHNVYKATFNGLRPKKIGSVTRLVSSVFPLNNGDVLVGGNGRYVGEKGKLPKGWSYEDDMEKADQKHWVIRKGTSTASPIGEAEYTKLYTGSIMYEERYYTKELPTGGADILFQKNNEDPVKVGHLNEKIDTISPCEGSEYQVYPRDFTSSFNGKYLLTSTRGGGGTCSVTRHVITSDGKIKFNLEKSYKNIAFIGDNKLLLSHASDNKSEIVSLNEDGTFETQVIDLDLRKYSFSQGDISPSKKLLFLNPSNEQFSRTNTQAAIYNIESNSVSTIKGLAGTSRWDKNSDLVLIYYSTFDESDEVSDTTTLTLYDPATKMSHKLAEYEISSRDVNPVFILE